MGDEEDEALACKSVKLCRGARAVLDRQSQQRLEMKERTLEAFLEIKRRKGGVKLSFVLAGRQQRHDVLKSEKLMGRWGGGAYAIV